MSLSVGTVSVMLSKTYIIRITTSACQSQKQVVLVEVTMTLRFAPNDYVVATAGVSWLPALVICLTFGTVLVHTKHATIGPRSKNSGIHH